MKIDYTRYKIHDTHPHYHNKDWLCPLCLRHLSLFSVRVKYKLRSARRKAFTLVEALVAISILLVGILSAFALVTKSLATAPVIRDRLVASFLAQEKLEQIRQIRDTNFLKILNGDNSVKWTDGIIGVDLSDKPNLNGVDFTRTVSSTLEYISDPSSPKDHLVVDCTVTWKTKGHRYSFTAEDHLFNWINIK